MGNNIRIMMLSVFLFLGFGADVFIRPVEAGLLSIVTETSRDTGTELKFSGHAGPPVSTAGGTAHVCTGDTIVWINILTLTLVLINVDKKSELVKAVRITEAYYHSLYS